jgi:hypothetical protein
MFGDRERPSPVSARRSAGFAKGRDSKGEYEDLPPYQIHQILKLTLTEIRA